jgi:hypothetical protein
LVILAVLLGGAVLTADVVEVSRDPALMAPSDLPRASRTGTRPSRPRVPVPVFHPSILLDALEVEIPDLDTLDLALVDPELKRALAKRRLALAEKERAALEQQGPPDEPVSEGVTEDLIQVSGVEPHLLELIAPRPFVDPSAAVLVLPPPDPWDPIGWPAFGWIDFPLDPNDGIIVLKPLPGAKKSEDDEEEEPPPVIPEPGTATLLLLGLAVLGIARLGSSRNLSG